MKVGLRVYRPIPCPILASSSFRMDIVPTFINMHYRNINKD